MIAFVGALRDRRLVRRVERSIEVLTDAASTIIGGAANTTRPTEDAAVAQQATAFQGLANLARAMAETADRVSGRSTSAIALVVSVLLFVVGGAVVTLDSLIDDEPVAEQASGRGR